MNRPSRFSILLFSVLLVHCSRSRNTGNEPEINWNTRITEANLQDHVRFLTSPELAGRAAGTVGERAAADHVVRHLEKAGLKPLGPDWIVPVLSPGRPDTINVIGVHRGKTDRMVLIGAHMDHLGETGGQMYPGADDNASGVAAMLEICSALASRKLEKTLVCVAFGGEERGLLGSRGLVRENQVPLEQVDLMINLDMLGRSFFESLFMQEKPRGLGLSTHKIPPELVERITETGKRDEVELMTISEAWIQKINPGFAYDSMPFNERGISTLFFSSSLHPDYHRPSDTLEKLSFDALARRTRFIGRVAEEQLQNKVNPELAKP